jgi:predicted alpha/beta-hydrolase family hydrolase
LRNPKAITVPVSPGAATTALVYGAEDHPVGAALILGHGAGAGQQSPWMATFSRTLSALGLDIITFNFLYTEQRRRSPDRNPLLESCYRAVIDASRQQVESARRCLAIGGKSMGGRIATQVAAADPDLVLHGLVLLGYPLHPPGRPSERRDAHLPAVSRPMLFVQGSRDAFGTPAELAPVLAPLAPPATLHVVDGGDHSFKVSTRDPSRQAAVYDDVQHTIIEWMKQLVGG